MNSRLKRPADPRIAPSPSCLRGAVFVGLLLAVSLAAVHAAVAGGTAPSSPGTPASASAAPPGRPRCDNDVLTAYDGLLVLAPHPDDETLAFGGLTVAFMRQHKPVKVVVVTDGDAYCDACRFWKSGSVHGPTCNALDLSNFATSAVDSFAEVRRTESSAAAALLGRQPPEFLGYPDTGIAAAWLHSRLGRLQTKLRRSDFSGCPDCETCGAGYGGGPEIELTASTLIASLSSLIGATSPNTLVATTHWLDGHGDHAGLGNFVKTINDGLRVPRPVAYAVVHAHTPKATAHGDCWYPAPQALVCPCADEQRAGADSTFISDLRRHRFQPGEPASLPDDAPYGEARQLCLTRDMYEGEGAVKLAAVRAYRSQVGSLVRSGEVPPHLDAIIDCNGYLISFVRRTEAFVLTEPAKVTSCDPAGTWEGTAGESRAGAEAMNARLSLARTGERAVSGALTLRDGRGGEHEEIVVGEFDAHCGLTLAPPQRPQLVFRATVSHDGKSLYGKWGDETPGFFVVHR